MWVPHLLGSPGLSLEDGLGGPVVLVSHGAGERGQPLSVADAQVDIRVGDQQLNDDTVLVADGHVDRRPSFCILQGKAQFQCPDEEKLGKNRKGIKSNLVLRTNTTTLCLKSAFKEAKPREDQKPLPSPHAPVTRDTNTLGLKMHGQPSL